MDPPVSVASSRPSVEKYECVVHVIEGNIEKGRDEADGTDSKVLVIALADIFGGLAYKYYDYCFFLLYLYMFTRMFRIHFVHLNLTT